MTPRYTEEQPLHCAAQLGQVDKVRELLRAGAKADSRDRFNITPLMIAVRNGYTEIAQVLLEGGANVNARDRANSIWGGKRTPLLHACHVGRAGMVRFLVERGAEVNCLDKEGRAPLSYAILQRNDRWLGTRKKISCVASQLALPAASRSELAAAIPETASVAATAHHTPVPPVLH